MKVCSQTTFGSLLSATFWSAAVMSAFGSSPPPPQAASETLTASSAASARMRERGGAGHAENPTDRDLRHRGIWWTDGTAAGRMSVMDLKGLKDKVKLDDLKDKAKRDELLDKAKSEGGKLTDKAKGLLGK